MKQFVSFLSAAFLACSLLVAPQTARANVIEPTPALPPTVGGYGVSTACVTAPGGSACLVSGFISNFSVTATYLTTPSVEEDVVGTALFTGLLFDNVGGVPGTTFFGPLSGTANVGLSFAGRTPTIQTGTFPTTVTLFDVSGTAIVAGAILFTFDATLNPATPSTGSTTVTNLGNDRFDVSSSFEIFPQFSLNGGPFVPGPESTVSLQPSAVPEPSPVLLLLTGLGAIALVPQLRRNARAK